MVVYRIGLSYKLLYLASFLECFLIGTPVIRHFLFKAQIDEVELETELPCFGIVRARRKQLDVITL